MDAEDCVPKRIEDLAFPRADALKLLHLDRPRDAVDTEFYGFGWTRVEALTLQDADGAEITVREAVTLALHSADEQAAGSDDLQLEFDIDYGPDPEDYVAVMVSLAAFWAKRAGAVLADAGPADDVVLAMCNPHRRQLNESVTPVGPTARVWWAEGDVESWLVPVQDSDRRRIVLRATRWHAAQRDPQGNEALS